MAALVVMEIVLPVMGIFGGPGGWEPGRALKPAVRLSEPCVRALWSQLEGPWFKLGGSQSWLGGLEPAGGLRRHLGGPAERCRGSKLKAAG